MRLVLLAGQDLVEMAPGSGKPMRLRVAGADQPVTVAALGQHVDQHDVGQELGNLNRVDVGAAGHPPSGRLPAPIVVGCPDPRVGVGQRRGFFLTIVCGRCGQAAVGVPTRRRHDCPVPICKCSLDTNTRKD